VVEELLKVGANINITTAYGATALLLCLQDTGTLYLGSLQYTEEMPKLLRIAHLLLEVKCNVNHKAKNGQMAISLANSQCLEELVPLLVEYVAIIPPDMFFELGHTSLNKILFLVEHGLNVNA